MASLTVRQIPEDAKRRFRLAAAAHGRSMEEHLRQLVIAAGDDSHSGPSMLGEKRSTFRHAEAEPRRATQAYPPGMEPLPGESFVEHITRISRPGFDIERDDSLFELRDPYDDAG